MVTSSTQGSAAMRRGVTAAGAVRNSSRKKQQGQFAGCWFREGCCAVDQEESCRGNVYPPPQTADSSRITQPSNHQVSYTPESRPSALATPLRWMRMHRPFTGLTPPLSITSTATSHTTPPSCGSSIRAASGSCRYCACQADAMSADIQRVVVLASSLASMGALCVVGYQQASAQKLGTTM